MVGDELIIRLGVASYLRSCGYRVLEAGDTHQARAALEADDQIDIVFSDVQMPGTLDGFALARWVRQHCPHVRVILTSSIAGAHGVARHLCEGGAFMEKPYDHGELDRRIRRALSKE